MPLIMDSLFKRHIYPSVLRLNAEDDDEHIVLAMDQLYSQSLHPELWKDFTEELKKGPSFEEDPEAARNWRISEQLVERFKVVKAEIEEVKNEIREKLRLEEEEDKRLLEEEESQ